MLETLTGLRPPQPPENSVIMPSILDDNNAFEQWYRLRQLVRLRNRYTNLGPEDLNLPTVEPQRVVFRDGLGRNSRLKDTGFLLEKEVIRLSNHLNQGLDNGLPLAEALTLSVNELEVNIRTYNLEFIQTRTVLPHLNRFSEVNGVKRMVGDNGTPVINGVSAVERYGAVLEASIEVEESLKDAEPGTVRIINSPQGWSGFLDENGKPITYQDNQTMVFWVDKSKQLQGLTLVTDLTLAQSHQLSLDLGVDENLLKGASRNEEIANIVRNPALLSFPRMDSSPAQYVLDKILAIRGRKDFRLIQKDGSVEVRSVAETLKDIRRFDQLLSFGPREEGYLTELKQFILDRVETIAEDSTQLEIVNKIEQTVLKLTREYLINNRYSNLDKRNNKESTYYTDNGDNFDKEIAYLKTRAGCSSGTSILRGISLDLGSESVGMPSDITISDLTDKEFCIRCGACGKYIWCKVPKGGKCPKCPAVRECV